MTIKYVEGDLFGPLLASREMATIILPHVCNDKGAWGAGFVVPLGRTFPKAKEEYTNWAKHQDLYEDMEQFPFKMGETQFVEVRTGEPPMIFVCNMVAQTLGGKRPLFYNHLARCMDSVANFAPRQSNPRIVAPMLGAQLAGGRWDFVEELIGDCWLRLGIPVTIHYLPGQTPDGWVPPQTPSE